jgi:hypothetical protein
MELILKLITAAAAVTVAWVAVQGLQTWRAQLIGKAEYDLARRLLRGVLEVREQIATVRGPFMSAGEMEAALKADGNEAETGLFDDQQRKKATALAYNRRWSGVTKAMADLQADLLEAEVIWGDPVRAAHKRLLACVAELFSSLSMHLRAQDNPELQRQLGGKFDEYFAVVYQMSDDPAKDQFTNKVAAAVKEFEKLLRPHLSMGRSTRVVTRDSSTPSEAPLPNHTTGDALTDGRAE